MSKEEEKQEIVQRINLLDGAINVPANQKYRHLNLLKKDILSIYNDRFHDIIKDPIITEKSMDVADNDWYTFEVDRNATKKQIIHALEIMFKIAVVDVRTIITGTKIAHWNKHKKKLEKKVAAKKQTKIKKAMVKFNPDVELNMDKIQELMANREKMMGK
jgi:large subunit ribosomal protein L23